MLNNLLPRTLPFSHCLQAAVPVKELKDRHQLLKLQHGFPKVGPEHEAKGAYSGIWCVKTVRIPLEESKK